MVQAELQRPARPASHIVTWAKHSSEENPAWEAAYVAFESQEQETRKFLARLRRLGADTWPRDARAVELFCGRGNGLRALEQLGFRFLEGVDLSLPLLQRYDGPATLYAGDCRHLEFGDATKDLVLIQGGLHHLSRVPADVAQVFGEIRRVLAPRGRVLIVEPWLTPFLRLAHAACEARPLRRLWLKLDALARMIEMERETYEQWLNQPTAILELLDRFFKTETLLIRWGKLMFTGRRR